MFYRHMGAKIEQNVVERIRKYIDTDTALHVAGTDMSPVFFLF